MAKRRRLNAPFDTAPDMGTYPNIPDGTRAPETKSMYPLGVAPKFPAPPIASVSAEASAMAALQDLADEVTRAREQGRLVQAVPLDSIDEGWIARDRIAMDEEELTALIESLRTHGQRSAIEVVVLDDTGSVQTGSGPAQKRYGLISGWRRLTALKRLFAETGDARFSTVLAIQRRPEAAGDAYVAMVEENEIRLGLSYYERARIAALSVRAGVFPSEKLALQQLYANVSRAKRSKIGSFLRIFDSLDGTLRFPWAIPERLGLTIATRLEAEPAFASDLADQLTAAAPQSAEAEQSLIQRALKAQEVKPVVEDLAPVRLRVTAKGVVLEGHGVDDQLIADLRSWLQSRTGNA